MINIHISGYSVKRRDDCLNKWKLAFFSLVAVIVVTSSIVFYLMTQPAEAIEKRLAQPETEGSTLTVQTTTAEFEKLAKKYMHAELEKSLFPVVISMKDDIQIQSEIAVFTTKIPLTMHFEPIVDTVGNIELKHTKMNVGALKLPTETTLKLMSNSIDFPSWVQVIPNEAEIYVDLSSLKIANESRVKAKKIDLANNQIILEVIVPTK